MNELRLEHLGYSYNHGRTKVFEDLNFTFEKGNVYAIVGKSGAGKTTLLSLLSGLAKSTEGTVWFEDHDISKIDRYRFRSKDVGVIFQSFNLLPYMTALENVMLSIEVSGKRIKNKKEKALSCLESVGLDEDKAERRILKLSGGEQQRVAIARAISYDPDILLADEPTGNLDPGTQDEIISIFRRLAYHENKCVIIVTHSPTVAEIADVVYEIKPMEKKKITPVPKRKQGKNAGGDTAAPGEKEWKTGSEQQNTAAGLSNRETIVEKSTLGLD